MHESKTVIICVIESISGDYVTCLVGVAGSETRSVIICPRNLPAVLVHLAKIGSVLDVRNSVVIICQEAGYGGILALDPLRSTYPVESIYDKHDVIGFLLGRNTNGNHL